ncbi:radical SAM protein [Candidatus Woesearchaeota archaeon]|nr:radical SAM protein [Candidatus Woesearchaeota archaeon]
MVKVAFVEPTGAVSNVFAKYMTIPLLGPVYLGTIAKQTGYDVVLLNENILGRKVLDEELRDIDVLCLSCLTTTVNRGKEIARQYKLLREDLGLKSKAVIGGIHASMLPGDVVNYFDQVIVGEGEKVILDILSGARSEKVIFGERLENLDELPAADFTLLKGYERLRRWPVMTSRGCPFDCNFCSVTEMFGRGYRAMSPEKVMDDVQKYRKGTLFFADDNFAVDIARSNKILDLMVKNNFNREWFTQVRTDITKKPEFVAKMRKAGCKIVYVGLESINPDSLKEMKKSQTVDDIKRCIRVFHDNGIRVHGMFMLGNDSDTKKTFSETSEFCNSSELDYVQYMVLTPLPGTQLYNKLETEGRLLHKNWNFYDGLHAVFKPRNMSAAELQQGVIECFSDFYSYTKAINNGLNALAGKVGAFFVNMHVPSLHPSIMRLAGNKIVKTWIEQNKYYLGYLKTISGM